MNVVFTCGGTGGHINPAIAVANILKERHPNSNILFIGGKDNMEEELVPKAGYELITFPAYGIRRGKSLNDIKMNIKAIRSTMYAIRKCKKIYRDFKPDVIVGTGGYASFPALMAGAKMGIPTCVHEANAVPGLTTKMVSKKMDRVLVCFPECKKYYDDPSKVEAVGMPVHRDFVFTRKEDARKELGLDSRPVIVTAFGSQGAEAMNQLTAKVMRMEKDAGYPYQHIHAAGSYGWKWYKDYLRKQGVDWEEADSLDIREYIYDMPKVMAAADIIISRAGAASCNEIAVSGTPCILIPSPNVTDNHQEKNARAMVESGGAVMIRQAEATPELVMEHITRILEDKSCYDSMVRSLQNMSVPDCAERVCDIVESLAKK